MVFKGIAKDVNEIVRANLDVVTQNWLRDRISSIETTQSGKEFYLTYTLLGNKIGVNDTLSMPTISNELKDYLVLQNASLLEISRIALLNYVLAMNSDFEEKVRKLIEVADKGELETFLRFLVLLPNPEKYCFVAVEALRTNIVTVFEAIALNNPYAKLYFNEQQWNQMYLKAAFIQIDLNKIVGVEERANFELTRIISDYAHERWAASREINPAIWRPISGFINDIVLKDMKQLFESSNMIEKKVAAICCNKSTNLSARALLQSYPQLEAQVESGELTWEKLFPID